MSVAITCTPAAPVAVESACRIDLTGVTANDDTAYDSTAYPASPSLTYYLTFELGGVVYGKSYVFAVNGGKHTFNNYIFPEAGSWTVRLSNATTDASVQTQAVTVS